MPTRRKTKSHDFLAIARNAIEQTIGERLDGSPLPDPNAGKDPAAIARGRLGGKKGGVARAEALTASQRKKIARRAATERWGR